MADLSLIYVLIHFMNHEMMLLVNQLEHHMNDIISLIENSKKAKKELVASTVRMPKELYSFIEGLADEIEISKQEVMLKLLEKGAAIAKETLDGAEKTEAELEEPSVSGFHVLNTNKGNNLEDHEWMLANGAAAAFYSPWKFNIDRIKKDDVVFLYENGKGIVAYGRGTGKVEIGDHDGDKDETHYQKLQGFSVLERPLPAAELKKILKRNVVFLRTMSGMPDGQKILDLIEG